MILPAKAPNNREANKHKDNIILLKYIFIFSPIGSLKDISYLILFQSDILFDIIIF